MRMRLTVLILAVAVVLGIVALRASTTVGPTYQVSAGWTSMVPVAHGNGAYTVFFYNKDNGAMAVIYLQQWDPGCPTPTAQCVQ